MHGTHSIKMQELISGIVIHDLRLMYVMQSLIGWHIEYKEMHCI